MSPERPLRIAFLTYRGHPYTGGQGVYTRHMARELRDLGHHVEVFSGPPYPHLDEGILLTKLPSLDLYRMPDPFRIPRFVEFNDHIDVLEYLITSLATFAEPYTFSLRAYRELLGRLDEFDIVHDNQCLGTGIWQIHDAGLPVLGTIHHPITVDRRLETEHAPTRWKKFTKNRGVIAICCQPQCEDISWHCLGKRRNSFYANSQCAVMGVCLWLKQAETLLRDLELEAQCGPGAQSLRSRSLRLSPGWGLVLSAGPQTHRRPLRAPAAPKGLNARAQRA